MNTTSHKNVTGFIFHFHGISKPWDKFLTWLFVISSILSLSVLLFYVLLNFLLPNSIHHCLLLKTKICLFLHARAIVLCHDIMKYFDSNKKLNIPIYKVMLVRCVRWPNILVVLFFISQSWLSEMQHILAHEDPRYSAEDGWGLLYFVFYSDRICWKH